MSTTTQVPHDEAEKHVLGSLMHTRRAIEEVQPLLDPGDFYAPRHETIYQAITALAGRGEGVDPVTVADQLKRTGDLTDAGGALYLADLYAAPPTTSNVAFYARIVRDQAILRRLHSAGVRIAQLATTGEGDIDELVEHSRAEVDAVSRATAQTGWIDQAIDQTIDDLDKPTPVTPTPWKDLNHHIGGWAPGRLYVIGARPAVGKTLIAVNAATHLARSTPVALNTLEMSSKEIHHRILANLSSVNLTRIGEHRLTPDDWDRVSKALPAVHELRLSIDDRSAVTVTDIASHARSAARRYDRPLGMVVVDYLQLMATPTSRRHENRQQEVATISRRLKLLAKELHCPVVALSQLNRASEGRMDKKPTMADLRESGALEQDSDVVILLHADEDQPGTILAAVAKNRHGTTGAFELDKYGHYARITDQAWTPTRQIQTEETR